MQRKVEFLEANNVWYLLVVPFGSAHGDSHQDYLRAYREEVATKVYQFARQLRRRLRDREGLAGVRPSWREFEYGVEPWKRIKVVRATEGSFHAPAMVTDTRPCLIKAFNRSGDPYRSSDYALAEWMNWATATEDGFYALSDNDGTRLFDQRLNLWRDAFWDLINSWQAAVQVPEAGSWGPVSSSMWTDFELGSATRDLA